MGAVSSMVTLIEEDGFSFPMPAQAGDSWQHSPAEAKSNVSTRHPGLLIGFPLHEYLDKNWGKS